jgi:hypothetical protein
MRANRPVNAAEIAAGLYTCDAPCTAGGIRIIAQGDITDWTNAITARLPNGTAGIDYTAPGANTPAAYVVTISWTEVGQENPVAYQLRVEI